MCSAFGLGGDEKMEKTSRGLVISSADKVVDRYAEKYAHLNEYVKIRLISADFPARYGGFRDFEMFCKVALFQALLFA